MPFLTLTTDLGLKDFYVSAIKGAVYKEIPDTVVVDISHQIDAFDLMQAAFIIKHAYIEFPKNTVHIIGVDTEHDLTLQPLAVLTGDHYFIGPDNGIFTLIFDKVPDKIVTLENVVQDTDVITFPTKDLFVKAACHLLRGGPIEALGKTVKSFKKEVRIIQPMIYPHGIQGNVIFIDGYGNAMTNISRTIFKDSIKGRKFEIGFGRSDSFRKIHKSYNSSDVRVGDGVCLFNSSGNLEIAINKGNAKKLFGLKVGDVIRIEFIGSENIKK